MRPSNKIVKYRKFIKGDEDNQKSYQKIKTLTTSGFFEETKGIIENDGSSIPFTNRYLRVPISVKIDDKDILIIDNIMYRSTVNNEAKFYKFLSLELWEFME